ncbi:MAG: hypothetical protein JJU00_13995 [Opitutales bacterium]|nr:hypothetical protein [Opitutales bacterium]
MFNPRRIFGKGRSVYYASGTLLPGAPDLDEFARSLLADVLFRCAAFSGVDLFTYSVEPRGYSALVLVAPDQKIADDDELLRRTEILYGEELSPALGMDLEAVAELLRRNDAVSEEMRRYLASRMGDLSMFKRIVRQRFTSAINKFSSGIGSVWRSPFSSVIVEDHPAVRALVGAYIDLAPVRAGLAAMPEHYPWCGFGAIARGDDFAAEALARMVDPDLPPAAALGRYRTLMQLWGPYPEPEPSALRAAGELPLPASPAPFAKRQLSMERGGAVGRPEFILQHRKASGYRRMRPPPSGFTSEDSPVRVTHLRRPVPSRGRRLTKTRGGVPAPSAAAQ